jgi:hypothetical protein
VTPVRFLLTLQNLEDRSGELRPTELASAYSLTVCVSTTSTTIC